jgi:hypothetical protein
MTHEGMWRTYSNPDPHRVTRRKRNYSSRQPWHTLVFTLKLTVVGNFAAHFHEQILEMIFRGTL